MAETSPRFSLPYLVAGQAQKEVFHNEAVAALDGLVHLCVEAADIADPPSTPSPGQSWIVPGGATGAWAGVAQAVASWTEGGWRFFSAREGMRAWNRTSGRWAEYLGGVWTEGVITGSKVEVGGEQVVGARQPAIASPSGGTTIDAEARASIDSLIATLMSHGLID